MIEPANNLEAVGRRQRYVDGALGTAMPPLVLEPERWARPALLELEGNLHGGLSEILGMFRAGEVFRSGFLPPPDPGRLEAAVGLLQTVVDLHDELKAPTFPDSGIVKLVNLEYQTLLTVMCLVPGRSVEEQNLIRRTRAKSLTPTQGK